MILLNFTAKFKTIFFQLFILYQCKKYVHSSDNKLENFCFLLRKLPARELFVDARVRSVTPTNENTTFFWTKLFGYIIFGGHINFHGYVTALKPVAL